MKFLIPLLLLCSCVTDDYFVQNGQKVVHHQRKQFGGVSSYSRSDGSSGSEDYQVTARDFFNTVGTVVTAGSAAYVNHAKNASDALTVQQAQAQTAKTAQAKIAADAAAAKAAATPVITTPPQVVTFPK